MKGSEVMDWDDIWLEVSNKFSVTSKTIITIPIKQTCVGLSLALIVHTGGRQRCSLPIGEIKEVGV